ncbi:MAG: hypothetical protein GF364_01775 [Candidatus Lokiarchaeota archaeon]|nr:hypothetical protein [Candidatus Lokiarchaeota archaeon]
MDPTEKCSRCGRNAKYYQKSSGRYFCDKCFIFYFERKMARTISKYRLIEEDDSICLGISAGKDSLVMLYGIYQYNLKHHQENPIIGVIIDEGIEGYRLEAVQYVHRFMKKHQLRFNLIETSFQEHFGKTLAEMVGIIEKNDLNMNPCTVCGTIKRHILNKVAMQKGATKLAIGHNMDDIIQTLIQNIIRNDLDKIGKNLPHKSSELDLNNGKKKKRYFIPRIKPLSRLSEHEIIKYCQFKGFNPIKELCPYSLNYPIFRRRIKNFLDTFEKNNHEVKYNLLNIHYRLYDLLKEQNRMEPQKFNYCESCGQPTGSKRKICHYCELKRLFDV